MGCAIERGGLCPTASLNRMLLNGKATDVQQHRQSKIGESRFLNVATTNTKPTEHEMSFQLDEIQYQSGHPM